jgi:hypothetical protein
MAKVSAVNAPMDLRVLGRTAGREGKVEAFLKSFIPFSV